MKRRDFLAAAMKKGAGLVLAPAAALEACVRVAPALARVSPTVPVVPLTTQVGQLLEEMAGPREHRITRLLEQLYPPQFMEDMRTSCWEDGAPYGTGDAGICVWLECQGRAPRLAERGADEYDHARTEALDALARLMVLAGLT